ncbi:MAG TPA: DUF4349 domain-containing protein [Candidatus Methanoperedens sp.]|nr:DUF4349 domain-containing protein [Candidatus Methanoperedens sp.]HLB71229.1 DUF4349 domain-containing protein [Candidatus Methanoperedens sp.]
MLQIGSKLKQVLYIFIVGSRTNEQKKISDTLGVSEYSVPSRDAGANEAVISQDRKIISKASIQLEVDNVQAAFNRITNITLANGGYVSSSSVYGGDRKNGQVTVRVPQKNFHSAIEQIEALGTIKSREILGQDVTEEFIDLGARLGNLQKQETRLQEILKMASNVKEVLEVEHELERVRGEIERLTGRLNYLNQSVEISTITVSASEPAPFAGENWGIVDSLIEAARGFIESIRVLIVFTGIILPILIYMILVILIALGIKRKVLPRLPWKK